MTMTTCHPKFTANQRMIVHAALSRAVVRNGNQLPKELVEGRSEPCTPGSGVICPGERSGSCYRRWYSYRGRVRPAAIRDISLARAAFAVRQRHGGRAVNERALRAGGMRILVVDNYDSFVYNLVQYLAQLGADVIVRRNDAVSPGDLAELDIDGLLISPGPGTPQEAGQSMPLVSACATTGLPLFGVCLGHQAIAAVFGAPIIRAPELLHGKTSEMSARRYGRSHRAAVAVHRHALPLAGCRRGGPAREIIVTGRSRSGVVMALRHRTLPIDGVQFHPESVLTHGGHRMVANWLVRCGGTVDDERVAQLSDGVDALRSTAFADV